MWRLLAQLWPFAFVLACLAGGWLAAVGCASETLWRVALLGPMPICWACRHFRSDDTSIALLGAAVQGIEFSGTIHYDTLTYAGYLSPIWMLFGSLGGLGPLATFINYLLPPETIGEFSRFMLFGAASESGLAFC